MKQSFKEFQKGLYVAVRLSTESSKLIDDYAEKNKIPVDRELEQRKHCTLIYSTVGANVELDPNKKYVCHGGKLEIFNTDSGKNCLVLLLNSGELMKRHRELMSTYKLNYSYPVYKPHVTISYDVGNLDIGSLPPFTGELIFSSEYKENLND